jgi:hypothetical protein
MAGTLVANTINTDTGLFSTNNAYTGIAKAWVNFGYISSAVSVVNSFNVSSVTRNSTGNYTINFATAMTNANYVLSGGFEAGSGNNTICIYSSGGIGSAPTLKSTTQAQVICSGGAAQDPYSASVIFIGN